MCNVCSCRNDLCNCNRLKLIESVEIYLSQNIHRYINVAHCNMELFNVNVKLILNQASVTNGGRGDNRHFHYPRGEK